MLLQLFALAEGLHQLAQHQLFVIVQGRRVGRVHRGEGRVPQRAILFANTNRVVCPVDAAQKVPPLHLEVRVAVDDLTFQLEHQDADGLVHHRAAVQHAFGIGAAGRVGVGHPDGQIVLPIELLGHALQMPQVDAVAILEHAVVVIGQRGLEHRADADGASGGGTHPHHVVVAPLDVHVVVAHEQVQNDVRARATVKQVAHDVQLVHRQMLDQLAQPHDETVCPAVLDDAAHDLPIIQVFVVVLKMGVEQLVQDIAAAGRQALPHMVAGVFGRYQPTDVNEPQQGVGVPLVQLFFAGAAVLELRQLFVGVVDQGGQLSTGLFRDGLPQHQVHFFTDDPGGRVQNVDKGFVFAVQVAHEMFGALGQLEQGLCTDDLAGRRSLRRVIPREQGQIFEVIADLIVLGAHEGSSRKQLFSFYSIARPV